MDATKTHNLQDAISVANSNFCNPDHLEFNNYMPWDYVIHEGVLAGARSMRLSPQWGLKHNTQTNDGGEHKAMLYPDFATLLITSGEDSLGNPTLVSRVLMLIEIKRMISEALDDRDCQLGLAKDQVIEQCQYAFHEDINISRIVIVACSGPWWTYQNIHRNELLPLSDYYDPTYDPSYGDDGQDDEDQDDDGLVHLAIQEWSPPFDLRTPQGLQKLLELRPILEQIKDKLDGGTEKSTLCAFQWVIAKLQAVFGRRTGA